MFGCSFGECRGSPETLTLRFFPGPFDCIGKDQTFIVNRLDLCLCASFTQTRLAMLLVWRMSVLFFACLRSHSFYWLNCFFFFASSPWYFHHRFQLNFHVDAADVINWWRSWIAVMREQSNAKSTHKCSCAQRLNRIENILNAPLDKVENVASKKFWWREKPRRYFLIREEVKVLVYCCFLPLLAGAASISFSLSFSFSTFLWLLNGCRAG